MLFLSSLQSDPRRGLCWRSVSLKPSGNNEGSSESLIQEWPSKTTRLGRYWIGPLKALTFSFANLTTDFTFCCYPWGQLCICSLPFFLTSLSLFSLSLCFPHLLYCVSVRSTASACFESFPFHRNAYVWEACCLRGETEMSSLIFCRKWQVLYVSDLKWTLLFGI